MVTFHEVIGKILNNSLHALKYNFPIIIHKKKIYGSGEMIQSRTGKE